MARNSRLRVVAREVLETEAAMTIQSARAFEHTGPGFSLDCYFFAITVRHVVHAVERLRDELAEGPERTALNQLLRNFKEASPGWRNVRNVIEHRDAYMAGEGRLQDPKWTDPPKMPKEPPQDAYSFFGFELHYDPSGRGEDRAGPSHKTLVVACLDHADPAEFRLDISSATDAARHLGLSAWDRVKPLLYEDEDDEA